MSTLTRRFADSYVEITNAEQYDQLATLFAEESTFLAPDGRIFNGRQEIGEFYETFLPKMKGKIRLASFVEQGNSCVYELEAKLQGEGEYLLSAIDHATLDEDGLVTRFAVYTRVTGR